METDPPSPLAPLFTPEEADELSELMLSFDGGMLDFGELDGFLSALAVAPQPTTLERWWGALFGPEPEWEAEHEPARARALAEGDAADRVLLAGLLGTDAVARANRNQLDFQKDLLQGLANDPYPAVRLVAARSGARRPDLALPPLDPLAAPPHDDRRRNPAPVTLSE